MHSALPVRYQAPVPVPGNGVRYQYQLPVPGTGFRYQYGRYQGQVPQVLVPGTGTRYWSPGHPSFLLVPSGSFFDPFIRIIVRFVFRFIVRFSVPLAIRIIPFLRYNFRFCFLRILLRFFRFRLISIVVNPCCGRL